MRECLGADVPPEQSALGNLDLLTLPKTALFCSARCPGDVILRAYDQAAKWCALWGCLPPDWKKPLATRRLLIFSRFNESERRVTADLAARRNEFVAALADEVWFAHITPGGRMAELNEKLKTI